MTSNKPYIIRAIYEWIVDNGKTPHLLVRADYAGVQVPPESVQDDRVVLNISARATQSLHIGEEMVAFSARFQGREQQVFLPVPAICAIYALENRQGIFFSDPDDAPTDSEQQPDPTPPPPPSPTRPHLQRVK